MRALPVHQFASLRSRIGSPMAVGWAAPGTPLGILQLAETGIGPARRLASSTRSARPGVVKVAV